MNWSKESQLIDESFPSGLHLESTTSTRDSTASIQKSLICKSLNFNAKTSPNQMPSSSNLPLRNSLRQYSLPSSNPKNETRRPSLPADVGQCKLVSANVPPAEELAGSGRERSQSKDSQESVFSINKVSKTRPVVTFRRRSKSEVDFKNINRKKFPHVESKVKRYIDQMAVSNRPRVTKQKSMPELHESSKEVEEGDEQQHNLAMAGQASLNSIPEQVAQELQEREKQIEELRDWLKTVETNLQEKQEENLCLKRKIEQMRGKLYLYAERRSSVPTSNLNVSFNSSQIDLSPFSNPITPVKRRPIKLVASKSVQTSLTEDELLLDYGPKSADFNLTHTDDDASAMRRTKSETMVSQNETNRLLTTKTFRPVKSQLSESMENVETEKSILEKSKSSFHRLHVSFKSNNSYQVFEQDSTSTTRASDSVASAGQEDGNRGKRRKKTIFSKFLKCFRKIV